ncbi:shikimate dehydrogenase [Herbiconiux ginsengi]|uniref:Shikimate dehydrogenase n=1 Tax=Herbiconiux ginsengi TaxID=381665 RepID=A0A1H3RKZ6_9MICO|nr:shikimate dehydrogenase [Herbiconiux ginsengi]SDZ26336.1 shikimate dehydrogenase [Herbiconiux ginsengi]
MTRRYLVGLIGAGITESLTPPMHEREGRALGFDYEYRVLDILELGRRPEEIGAMLAEAWAEGFDAVNVTHPCKQLIIPELDALTPDAERLGAVNLVTRGAEGTLGHNTDWTGFRRSFADGLPGVAVDLVAQIGAGGAGAATGYALLDAGTRHLLLVDDELERAEALARSLGELFPDRRVDARNALNTAEFGGLDGVVHATPTGMKEHPGTAFDVAALAPTAWLAEVVYRPLDTELLLAARARGLRTLDGGRMAVGQAVDALHLITGVEPDAERMRAHFLDLVDADERTAKAAV